MADIVDHHGQNSPIDADESQLSNSNENRGMKRQRASVDDDDDDDAGNRERRKIEIKFIADKSRRHITFSKRKAGIMKKAYELSVLTGTQVLLLVVSETGLVYTFTTPKLQPLVTKAEGKNLIQACLNAPEPAGGSTNEAGVDDSSHDDPEDVSPHPMPTQASRPAMTQDMHVTTDYLSGMENHHHQAQALAYQSYIQQRGPQYALSAQSGMPQHAGHQT